MSAHGPNEQATAEALRASELRYRRLFESAKDGILILDAETGAVVDANPSMAALLGLTREALLGKRAWELGCFKTIAANAAQFAALQAQDCVQYEALPLETADGQPLWVEFVSNVYLLDQQRMLQGNFRDITAHKRMEAALRQEQLLMLTLMHNVPDHIYFKDTASRFLRINPGLAKVFGLSSPAQAVGKTDADFFSAEHAQMALADEQAILRTGLPLQDVEEKETWPDGSESWVLTSKVPLRDDAGRMIGTCGISCDITARKRAEMALRQEQILMLTLMNNVPDHIYFKDTASRFLRINPGLAQRFGLASPEQAAGKTDADFFSAEHAQKALADEQAILRTGQPLLDVEEKETWPDGSEGWVLTSKVPLFDDAGHITGTCGISNDITARKRAEAALRESEALLSSIATNTKDIIFVKDREGRFAFMNPAGLQFNCTTADQVLGHSQANAYLTPAEVARLQADDQRVMATGRTETITEELVAADGTRHAFLTTKGPRLDGQGQIIGLVGIAHDITERQRAEDALRESEASLRAFFDSPGLLRGVVEVVPGDILHINDNVVAAQFFGRTVAEMRHQRASALGVPPETLRRWLAHYAESQRTGRPVSFDYDHGQGEDSRHFRVTITYLGPGQAGPRHAYVVEDISEQKRALAAQSRLATAVEQAAEAIVITDLHGAILYANPVFETTTGYTRAEALGRNPNMLKSGQHDAEFYRQMWATLTAGQVWTGHLINKRKDGTLFEEDATISPVIDSAGTVINYVAVKRDITREVALEAQHRQAMKMEAVGQLAGGVAHDFNNQLQVILGCAENILFNLPPDHPIQAELHEIQTAARHSADLTRQLLGFSRKQMTTPVVLDLNAALSGSLKMLVRLIGANIHLHFIPQPQLGSVFMDPHQLNQILVNLVVNASDAMTGAGNIEIEAFNATLRAADCQDKPDFVPPGEYVGVRITDDGAGMTPEIQAHLFEPFFTTKGVGKGTGLGLATVYGIVKQNHGAITLHSAPGLGTTFTIYLPRTAEPAPVPATTTAARLPTGTETILLVEDEQNVLGLVQRVLTRQGYKVLSAETPQLALQLGSEYPEPLHLLLTDVIMPGLSGNELAERIRKVRPGLRVLYMSGYSADILDQPGHSAAGPHLLQKPFNATTLAQQVRAALDETPTSPQS